MICRMKSEFNELSRLLEKEGEVPIKWFSDNNVIANPNRQ